MVRFLAALEMTREPPVPGMARVTRRITRFLAALEMTGGHPIASWRAERAILSLSWRAERDIFNNDRRSLAWRAPRAGLLDFSLRSK
ncbi:hypothetical protein [Roseiflexus sp.]|uniref:hypothetical protein n=1 Tax=Roseiflexus sp. TaxID=2562120 RepID=UPI0021DF2C53|nr:hypothetical protein [Roseiflexus sp.]GIW00339.1 MAG: hypothetical protein KatS3mg058_1742 [Roseiflexus sp.]